MREVFDRSHQRVPVRLWPRAPPAEAVRPLVRLSCEPWIAEVVAGMADLHVAEGVAVGTVFATEHHVVPWALGGDLGCGMSVTRLSIGALGLDREALVQLVDALDRAIPSGDGVHRGAGTAVPESLLSTPLSTHALDRSRDALARRHLGTLGGGNHFLELDRDADGDLWLLVHSGSRGLGAAIAAHHRRAAEASPERVLDVASNAGDGYVRDVAFALAFAAENRKRLARRAVEVISDVVGESVDGEVVVDVHHNFVDRETWDGRELWVHRKGAVRAAAGALALIPGSMGTASYLVEGLGCAASLGSCSHGAGRVLRRSEARRQVAPSTLARAMRKVVYPEARARTLVEEAPCVYRDLGEVLDDQEDLVARRLRLEPVAVLKG